MSGIKCFMIEPTGTYVRKLRCWGGGAGSCSASGVGFHAAEVELDRGSGIPHAATAEGHEGWDPTTIWGNTWEGMPGDDDPRWPAACACGWIFGPEHRYRDQHQLWRRVDGVGDLFEINDAQVGAMWDATWLVPFYTPGPDGKFLVVMTPGGHWQIDGPASNCTMPEDRAQAKHHCWIRHGVPPDLTVDKNGVTCSAGGGSIQAGNYHGFLRNGELVQ